MITEEQRRALFALREALHLCDQAHLMLSLNEDGTGMTIDSLNSGHVVLAYVYVYLSWWDIDTLLWEHPE